MPGWWRGVCDPKDKVSTLTVPFFLICLEDGNDVAGKIFDIGVGEDGLKEVICKGGRGDLNDTTYCIQSGDCKKVLYHNHKLPKRFWDSRLGGEGNMVYRM